MKSLLTGVVFVSLLGISAGASPQEGSSAAVSSSEAASGGVPIEQLIAAVSKKAGNLFIVDPRVHAGIHLVGQDVGKVDYPEFLMILQVYGFAAVEEGGVVRVFPDAAVRQMPLPQVSDGDKRPDAEYVSTIVHVKSVPAVQLVPILRPLLPQVAHLAALPCTNTLIIVDSFANVRRLEALIRTLDTGEPYKVTGCRAPQEEPSDRRHQE